MFISKRFPVDDKTPVGFLIAGSIEVVLNVSAAVVFAITLGLNYGICCFLTDFILDLEENLRQLDTKAKHYKKLSPTKLIEMKTNFIDVIQFYGDSRELSYQIKTSLTNQILIKTVFFRFMSRFSDINGTVIFAYMIFSVVSFCSLYLQIDAVSV